MDLDTLAAELHAAANAEWVRHHPSFKGMVPYAGSPDNVKDYWRAAARRALELLGTARTITVGIK